MARDYARRNGNGGRSKGGPRGGIWFLAGLLPGLLIALLVYLDHGEPPQPVARTVPPRSEPAPAKPAPAKPAQAKKEPAKKEPPAPRFEFYTILPEMEVVVPDRGDEPPPPPPPAPKPATTATAPSAPAAATPAESARPAPAAAARPAVRYYLQAGSFRRFEDADRVKAQLALLGVVAGVQRVTINGGETWHRVRIGPYTDLDAVERLRQRLRGNDISTLLVKDKG